MFGRNLEYVIKEVSKRANVCAGGVITSGADFDVPTLLLQHPETGHDLRVMG